MFGARFVYCPLSQVTAALPTLQELGLGVEVLLDSADAIWPHIRWEEIFAVADAVTEAGLQATVHGPFNNLNPGARDPYIRDYSVELLSAGLEVSRAFRSQTMVFHTGFLPQYNPHGRKLWMDAFCNSLEKLLADAGDIEVRLAMENTYEQDLSVFQEVFDRFPSPGLGMCLDTSHATCFGRVNPALWAQVFRDRICHIHCSDNDGKDDLHWSLGDGVVNFRAILEPLGDYADSPTVTFEVSVDQARESRDHFEKLASTFQKQEHS